MVVESFLDLSKDTLRSVKPMQSAEYKLKETLSWMKNQEFSGPELSE
tara:strand:- start:62 stop:202 length:141 start_codon:yes stop_codon:yes gene_type:complete